MTESNCSGDSPDNLSVFINHNGERMSNAAVATLASSFIEQTERFDDVATRIAQQRELDFVLTSERFQNVDRIVADCDDLNARRFDLLYALLQLN